ncbi:putative uncharacterized protein [Bacteroides sp. CAG:709]|nr:putative uncharacterized protein [Bacteroides sp. CAG:709]
MNFRFLFLCIIALILTLTPAAGQTGLYSYEGGYFLRNGSHWEEYRPDTKVGVWSTYEQYNEEQNFFNIKNSKCSVSVPKNTSCSFYYAEPGGEWESIYTTCEIYDYMPSEARNIYCYKGGYFVRDGMDWYEYRPGDRHGVWNSYEQLNSDGNFIYLTCKSADFHIGIPKTESIGSIYMKKGDGEWTPIYTLTGIYDSGKGYEYSIPFGKLHSEDSADSLSMYSCINIDCDGTGRVRYSDKNYSFEFSAANLYEASGDIGSMLFMLLVGGSPGDSEGFVLYADEEMKEEVLSYTKAYGKIVCEVTGVPGLEAMEFMDCENESPGERIHDLIRNVDFL